LFAEWDRRPDFIPARKKKPSSFSVTISLDISRLVGDSMKFESLLQEDSLKNGFPTPFIDASTLKNVQFCSRSKRSGENP